MYMCSLFLKLLVTVVTSVFLEKGNLNKHVASVHEGNKPFKCEVCDYRSAHWKDMFHQFMKWKSHSNVKYVTTDLLKNMLPQCMKVVSSSIVKFVTSVVLSFESKLKEIKKF